MRPRILRVKGFTAFRDEQVLDLGGLDLFAIAGPTGAGKSSLLDAMTYALFGKVERVGDQVTQLISHGLPALFVELEFDVGGTPYRVARRAQTKGASRAILEQGGGGGAWTPIADQSREVTRRVEALIGLDYGAFTRAVLLPQGKFDQFLSGKPDERRRILTELLDLGLFERMAKTAGSLARDAEADAAMKRALLEREYRGATTEGLADMRES
ncbi:MAG: SMC family ATPase, partial [Chloroflexi bacterium]|nr:SMC family ATPase [Chloroflexota bacterium]